ncbi:MAG: hypothetical protein K1X64_07505 [Myxococcaceae bacterium]|nr:hypothetical protein [Myxococcaceae bacterium]
MHSSFLFLLTGLGLCACGTGVVSEAISPTPFEASVLLSSSAISSAPGFADQRGGGIFAGTAGQGVRLRADGSQAPLLAHPGNPVAPGPVTAVWPLGPFSALLGTSTGLFVAESGWVIAPPWQSRLSADGLVATGLGADGVAWLAHQSGLFRLENGQLFELTSSGAHLEGITSLAVAPGPSGAEAVWFAGAEKLHCAERQSAGGYLIKESGLSLENLKGGVLALAGIAPSPKSAGELWAITQAGNLWRFRGGTWFRYALAHAPEQLLSAGRFAWLRVDDALYRYDADEGAWGEAKNLAAGLTLQAVDAAGTAWVREREQSHVISNGWVPRLSGIFQNEEVYGTEAVVTVQVSHQREVQAVRYRIDEGEESPVRFDDALPGTGAYTGQWVFSLGGADNGEPKPFSLTGYNDGPHTLSAIAVYKDGALATRRVHFELKAGLSGPVAWQADIKPLFEARCAKCHVTGPGRDLSVYELWKREGALIVTAVKDKRMPADGPLDPTLISRIVRWVNGGMLP